MRGGHVAALSSLPTAADHAAPAMYRATRPQFAQRSVTCDRGGGGVISGSRLIFPEHEGQLRGAPFRSLAMSCSACAGLYVAGRGFRMRPSNRKSPAPRGRRGAVTAPEMVKRIDRARHAERAPPVPTCSQRVPASWPCPFPPADRAPTHTAPHLSGALDPADSGAVLARQLTRTLYRRRPGTFPITWRQLASALRA